MSRPNVLLFMTDQQRADHLGSAGHPVLKTPNLDRLAAEGVQFDRAYVNCPLCMPSRATMLTGLTPRAHQVRTNGINLQRVFPTLPEGLRRQGYRTHSVGKIHASIYGLPNGSDPECLDPADYPESQSMWAEHRLSAPPLPYYGFESVELTTGHGGAVGGAYRQWLDATHAGAGQLLSAGAGRRPASQAEQAWIMALPPEWHYNTWVADRSISFLEDVARSDHPFLLQCSFPDPHHPYCPPEVWAHCYEAAEMPLPVRRAGELDALPPFYRDQFERDVIVSGRQRRTNISDDQLRDIRALTCGMVSFVDEQVGRVLMALDRLGLREQTIVIFLSDHGDMLGDHWMLNKGPFHFEGLLRVPFLWSWRGHFLEGARSQALVSLLDLVPALYDLTGVPVLEGDLPLRVEAPRQPPALPGRSLTPVLRGERPKVQDALVVENDEYYLGLRLRTLITERYVLTAYPGHPFGELWDLQEDPQQLWNRWDDPALAEMKRDLTCQLFEELVRTDGALPRRLCHA
ncbi:MAG: sulfatase-like hydrolase/transferase [Chloroflexi bacterium]|nr:sulfatase-like hydrolase/transferase [Chloroflexota bacterium]